MFLMSEVSLQSRGLARKESDEAPELLSRASHDPWRLQEGKRDNRLPERDNRLRALTQTVVAGEGGACGGVIVRSHFPRQLAPVRWGVHKDTSLIRNRPPP